MVHRHELGGLASLAQDVGPERRPGDRDESAAELGEGLAQAVPRHEVMLPVTLNGGTEITASSSTLGVR